MIIEGPWDWEMAMKVREQEHEEELAEAKVKERAELLQKMMMNGNMTFDQLAELAGLDDAEREQIRAMI